MKTRIYAAPAVKGLNFLAFVYLIKIYQLKKVVMILFQEKIDFVYYVTVQISETNSITYLFVHISIEK